MKNLKKVIIILAIALIIIFICILALSNILKNNQETEQEENHADISGDFIKQLGIVEDYRTFFSVEAMLENFVKKIEGENKQEIYNFLDSEYILEKNITQENVLEKIPDIKQYASKVKIRKIYVQETAENAIYYIDAILEKDHKGNEFYFVMYEDKQNLTYAIELINKETFEQEISKENQELERKTIEKNESNKTILANPTEKEIVTKYFEDFIENALYYPEYAYSLINNEYKEKSFKTLEDFKEYIETKKELFESYNSTNLKSYGDFNNMDEYLSYLKQINNLELEQYQITYEKKYNKYICIDSEGNYYTFYATSPLNYTVILDNYIIPTEDFAAQYNNSSDVEKVILNIKRFFMGIDDKNYGYSYSVLSEAFKNNKYPTKNDFITYAKQNFFEKNEIEYISYEKENGLYIYKIRLGDATRTSFDIKEFNMIIKLNNGTDFEMSFGTN